MKVSELKVENPYVGPRPFEEREQRRFFGRDWEADELVSLVVAHPAVLLYAQSGAGKTSLINAKLIPLLRDEEGLQVMPVVRVRGEVPMEIQPEQIENLFLFNTLLGWMESGADPAQLVGLSLSAFLKGRPRPKDEEGRPTLRVIIFDQFEELFTLYLERWMEREGFFAQVADALSEDPFLRVLFVLREAYLAQLDPYVALLPERLRTRFRLSRLRREAGLAAVKGPLMDTERFFAPGVAESFVEELLKIRVETRVGETVEMPGEFVEPVQLQVVGQSLWEELSPGISEITLEHLWTFGDVDQALLGLYERALSSTVQQTKVREGKLRDWFERDLITPMGTRGTVYMGAKSTGGVPNAAVDALESQHLIRAERRAGARWYELTHDRFIGPIQRSNESWRAMQRGRWLRIGGCVIVILILLLVGITVLQAVTSRQEVAQMQATVTVAAWEVQQAAATAWAAASDTAAARATAAVEAMANEYVRQGFVYTGQGDYEQAIANYTKAIELDPNYVPAYFNRGDAYRDLGEYEQAIVDFTKTIELDPNDALAYKNRGDAYYQLGDDDQAISDYSQAIELDPVNASAYDSRGLAYRNLGNYEEAIADYSQAIELDPDYAIAYSNRGVAYYEMGSYDQAIADLETYLQLEPDADDRVEIEALISELRGE